MRHLSPALPPLAALALLTACGEPADDPVRPEAPDAPMPVEPDGGIGDGAGPPPVALDVPEFAIPETLQGRWGLTANDCVTGRADAKGLLVISPTTLTFYESVGKLKEIADASPGKIRASYMFSGEGMNWESDTELKLEDGGKTLIRREFAENAGPDAFTYSTCD
jgi:hypothetical protein